jgi:hypothetical protein
MLPIVGLSGLTTVGPTGSEGVGAGGTTTKGSDPGVSILNWEFLVLARSGSLRVKRS